VCAAPARAQLIFYEPFEFTAPGDPMGGKGDWTKNTAIAGFEPKVGSPGLTYPGFPTAPGSNSIMLDGTGVSQGTPAVPPTGVVQRSLGQTINSGTLYYSMLLNVTQIQTHSGTGSGFTTAANWNTGSFMAGFARDPNIAFSGTDAGDAGAALLIRTSLNDAAQAMASQYPPTYQLGIGVGNANPTRTWEGGSNSNVPTDPAFPTRPQHNPGDTLLIVGSYTFNPGDNNDVARLWVNPLPGTAESANVAAVVTAAGLADINQDRITAFFFRNNSVEPDALLMDELRVGTTWESVTPVPEPSAAALAVVAAGGLLARRRRR
jgi:MYXO-CTERM domain-containing protein